MTTTKEIGFMAEYTPVYLSEHQRLLAIRLLEEYATTDDCRGNNHITARFWRRHAKELIKNIKEAEGNNS